MFVSKMQASGYLTCHERKPQASQLKIFENSLVCVRASVRLYGGGVQSGVMCVPKATFPV